MMKTAFTCLVAAVAADRDLDTFLANEAQTFDVPEGTKVNLPPVAEVEEKELVGDEEELKGELLDGDDDDEDLDLEDEEEIDVEEPKKSSSSSIITSSSSSSFS